MPTTSFVYTRTYSVSMEMLDSRIHEKIKLVVLSIKDRLDTREIEGRRELVAKRTKGWMNEWEEVSLYSIQETWSKSQSKALGHGVAGHG